MTLCLCHKSIVGRSRYESLIQRRCFREADHPGSCDEFPYIHHLEEVAPRVAAKIKRDATKTTGAAWKSEDAGPNRIDRWVMLLPDDELRDRFKINIAAMKPTVQAKLREKAASYDECMAVAAKLTWSVYQMRNAPSAPAEVQAYLEARFGAFSSGTTRCIVCRDHLDFDAFARAQRGRAHIETAHANPRLHNPENVGFAHRECNIAQGGLSLNEFYNWIRAIIARVEADISAEVEAPRSHSSTSLPKD
jgi:hypothetical protein